MPHTLRFHVLAQESTPRGVRGGPGVTRGLQDNGRDLAARAQTLTAHPLWRRLPDAVLVLRQKPTPCLAIIWHDAPAAETFIHSLAQDFLNIHAAGRRQGLGPGAEAGRLEAPAGAVQRQPEGQGPLKPADRVIFGRIGDQFFLGNIATGESRVLRGVAAEVWQAVIEHGRWDKILYEFSQRFKVEDDQLRWGLNTLLSQLTARGYLTGFNLALVL